MVLGVSQLAQGAVMLLAPAWFYAAVPGVDETGPFNPHLMRDVGCAYLVLHALMHVWDGLAGRERAAHLAHDLPLLLGLAAAALWTVWPEARALYLGKDSPEC